MPRPEVPDTSVWIDIFRRRGAWERLRARVADGNTWLSAVAVAELYAGTRSRADAMLVERLVVGFTRAARLMTPTADDWRVAGQLLARRVRLQGPLRPRDHLADVLIAVSAARIQGTVVTANGRHFQAWASLAAASGLNATVTPYDIERTALDRPR